MKHFRTVDTPSLINEYAAMAAEHARATRENDVKLANRSADQVAGIYRELRLRGLEAQQMLLPLLTSQDLGVRCWAAAHAMDFAPEFGQSVLESLSTINGPIGFDATMTLKLWKEKRLIFP